MSARCRPLLAAWLAAAALTACAWGAAEAGLAGSDVPLARAPQSGPGARAVTAREAADPPKGAGGPSVLTPAADHTLGLDPSSSPRVRHREGEAAGLYYLESVVGAVPPDAALPLVVALHGLGDRPRPLAGPFFDTPDPVRIVQPRAPTPLGEGYTWLPVRVSEGRIGQLSRAALEMSDQLASFLEAVRTQRATRGRPIVTGFSQGAILAFTLAVRHPGALAESLPVAGWLPPPLWPHEPPGSSAVPIRSMHGTADPVVPLGPTRTAVTHLASLGYPAELVEIRGLGHVRGAEMDVLLARWLAEAVRRQWRLSWRTTLAEPVPGFGVSTPTAPERSDGRGTSGRASDLDAAAEVDAPDR